MTSNNVIYHMINHVRSTHERHRRDAPTVITHVDSPGCECDGGPDKTILIRCQNAWLLFQTTCYDRYRRLQEDS